MPSMTLTISADKWTRLSAALQQFRDEEHYPGETDAELAKRWLRMVGHDLVWSYERDHQGSDNAVGDWDMDVE